MSTVANKTHIEQLWGDIVGVVDGMVTEEDAKDVMAELEEDESKIPQKIKVVKPKSRREVEVLTGKTIQLLEEVISLMYFGTDLSNMEMRSDSSFLAKLSNRLHRKVTLTMDAPMAVAMYKNDRNVYLMVNPIRLRFLVETVGEILAIVRHELYHILYNHLGESKNYPNDRKTQYILNIAQDCEINQSPLIKDSLPEGAISLEYVRKESGNNNLPEHAGYVEYYKALVSSEEYQQKLKGMDNQDKKVVTIGASSGGSGANGESSNGERSNEDGEYHISQTDLDEMVGENAHATWGDEEVSQDTIESVIGGVIRDTYNSLSDKERGLLSRSVKGQIEKLDHTPDVDWRDKIRRQHGKMKSLNKRKTLARPNRRFPNRLDLKGKLPDYDINIVMALDVSGSVSDGALKYAMGEGFHLSRELNAPLTLLQIDSDLVSEQVIKKPTDFNLVKLNGRGGTRFQPAFDYLDDKSHTDKTTLLVYVTDGYGESEGYLNRHGFNNVLWLLVDTNDKNCLSCDGKGRVELLNNDTNYMNNR